MIKYAGVDPEGTARVYGEAIQFHVNQHPETGPVSAWLIKRILEPIGRMD